MTHEEDHVILGIETAGTASSLVFSAAKAMDFDKHRAESTIEIASPPAFRMMSEV